YIEFRPKNGLSDGLLLDVYRFPILRKPLPQDPTISRPFRSFAYYAILEDFDGNYPGGLLAL
ncbi:hypothetical protein PENANT_c119G01136, partial [Penicillium antarcticum]